MKDCLKITDIYGIYNKMNLNVEVLNLSVYPM